MNKFKRKPVAQSPTALGRQMAADAQRMRKKIEKQKLVTSEVKWLGASATAATASTVEPDEWTGPGYWATVDDMVKLDQEDYKRLGSYFDLLLKPTTVVNGDGTYTHSVRLRSLDFSATVA